jgi:hypothetical protein
MKKRRKKEKKIAFDEIEMGILKIHEEEVKEGKKPLIQASRSYATEVFIIQ